MAISNVIRLSIAHLFLYSVCGIVIILLGTTIATLAEDVGRNSTQIGLVFVTRSCGSLTGLALRQKYGEYLYGNTCSLVTLVLLIILLLTVSFVTSLNILKLYYFCFGFCVSILELNVIACLRLLHGHQAGPWITSCQLIFSVSGVIVPIIQIMCPYVLYEYIIFSFLSVISFLVLLFSPDITTDSDLIHKYENALKENNLCNISITSHNVDIVCGFIVLLTIGSNESVLFYLESYISNTNVLQHHGASNIFLVFTLSLACASILLTHFQTHYITDYNIIYVLIISIFIEFMSTLLISIFPTSSIVLIMGIGIFGFFSAICISLVFDVCNRYSKQTLASSTILLVGLIFGVSIVPYLSSFIWNNFLGPVALFYVVTCATGLSLVVVPTIPYLTEIVELKWRRQHRVGDALYDKI
jgi:hypothetical protein